LSTTGPPRPAPASVSIDRFADILRSSHFGPALIQRHFEWTRKEAHKLLDNLERAHQRAEMELPKSDEGTEETGELLIDDEADLGVSVLSPAAVEIDEIDIVTAAEPLQDFFIGNIILRRSGVDQIEIYDGLQRFTTFTILLSVLRDQVQDTELRRQLDQHINSDAEPRLSLFGKDKTLQNHVQKLEATLRTKRANAFYDIGRRILYVKNAIQVRVEGWEVSRQESFARFLLSSVWASVLMVPEQAMAQEMFVNTNLYGKPLDVIDVLKGQLVELVSQSQPEEELARFTDHWISARLEAGNMFTEFLRAFDAIERCEIQAESWPTDLGLHVSSHYSAAHIDHFQRRLWAHMKGWKECRRILADPGESKLERDLWRLHVFRWPEWHPLALKWWLEIFFAGRDPVVWEQNKKLYRGRFNRLHRRCMAITLAGFSETDRQKIFRNALRQHNEGKDVFAGALFLTPHQRLKVDRTLRGQIHDKDVWAPLTRWLEMSRWQNDLPTELPKSNTEHVKPRSVNWEDDVTDDMQAYNEGCFSLGNLAVISRSANSGMQNDNFASKLRVLRKEAEKFWMVKSVVEDENGTPRAEWTNEIILARAEALRLEVWKQMLMKPPA
jgi:hypothetical protein